MNEQTAWYLGYREKSASRAKALMESVQGALSGGAARRAARSTGSSADDALRAARQDMSQTYGGAWPVHHAGAQGRLRASGVSDAYQRELAAQPLRGAEELAEAMKARHWGGRGPGSSYTFESNMAKMRGRNATMRRDPAADAAAWKAIQDWKRANPGR